GYRPLEDAAGTFPHGHVRGLTGLDVGRVRLRHEDEDAQDVDLREGEELGRPGGRPRGDQRAGIDVAYRDDAVEGRVHLLEALELEQATHVRLVGVHGCASGIENP